MLKKAPQKPVPRASARKTIEDELAIPANWEERLAIARAKREKVLAAKARAEERQSYAHVEPAPKPQKPTITLDKAQRLRDRMSKDGKPDLVSVAPTPPKADLVAPPLEKLTPQEQEEPEAIAPIPVVSNKPLPELVAATLDVAPPEPVVAEKKRPALALIALASCVGLGLGLALGIGLTGGFSLQGSPSPTEPQIADGTLKTTPTVETPVNSAIVGATGANAPLETGPEIWQALLTNSPGPSNAVFATDAGVRIANANFSNPRMTVPLVEPVRVSAPANVGSDTIVRLPTGWTTAPRLAQLGLPAESVQSQLSAFQPIVRPKTENVLIAALGPDAFGALNLVTEPANRVSITTSLSDAPALSTDDIFASAVPVSFVSASTPELRATLSIPVAPVPDAIAIRPSPLVNVLVSASSETPELNLPAFSLSSGVLNSAPETAFGSETVAVPAPLETASLEFVLPTVGNAPAGPAGQTFASSIGLTASEAARYNLYLFAPTSITDPDLIAYQTNLTSTGFSLETTRRVSFKISKTQIRYYNRSDAAVAKQLAGELGIIARDFTANGGDAGRIEIWMQGTSGSKPAPVARKTTPKKPRVSEQTQLTNSIINGLRTSK